MRNAKTWHGSDLLLATFFNLESKCNTRSWLIIHYDLKSINCSLLFLFQEIHQRDCNEPLRTRGEHDGNHASVQDQLYQVEQISLIWKVQIFLNLNVPGSSLRLFLTWYFSKTASKKRTSPLSSRRSPMTDTKFIFRWELRSFPHDNASYKRRLLKRPKREKKVEKDVKLKTRKDLRLRHSARRLPGFPTNILERRFRCELKTWLIEVRES